MNKALVPFELTAPIQRNPNAWQNAMSVLGDIGNEAMGSYYKQKELDQQASSQADKVALEQQRLGLEGRHLNEQARQFDVSSRQHAQQLAYQQQQSEQKDVQEMIGRLAHAHSNMWADPTAVDSIGQELAAKGYTVEGQLSTTPALPGQLPSAPSSVQKPSVAKPTVQKPAVAKPSAQLQTPKGLSELESMASAAPATSGAVQSGAEGRAWLGGESVQAGEPQPIPPATAETQPSDVQPGQQPTDTTPAGLKQLEELSEAEPATAGAIQAGAQGRAWMGGEKPQEGPARSTEATSTKKMLPGELEPAAPKNVPAAKPDASQAGQPGDQASGTKYVVKNRDGRVVATFDHDQIVSQQRAAVERAFAPISADPIGAKARNVALGRLGTTSVDEAIKSGLAMYETESNRDVRARKKGSGGGGGVGVYGSVGKAGFERAGKMNDEVRSTVRELRQDVGYSDTLKAYEVAQKGMLALNANSGFGDTMAIKQIVHALNGSNSSDNEFIQVYGAAGQGQRLLAELNKYTDDARLPDGLRSAVRQYFTDASGYLRRKKADAENRAAEIIRQQVLARGGSPEEAESYANIGRSYLGGAIGSGGGAAQPSGGGKATVQQKAGKAAPDLASAEKTLERVEGALGTSPKKGADSEAERAHQRARRALQGTP